MEIKIMLHENDEYILESNYLEGIGVYVGLIRELGSQTDEIDRQLKKRQHQND